MKRTLLLVLAALPVAILGITQPAGRHPSDGSMSVERVHEVSISVRAGALIDLAERCLSTRSQADLEVSRGPGGALMLQARQGIELSAVRRGPAVPRDVSSWQLGPASGVQAPSRTALLRQGDWLSFGRASAFSGRIELIRANPSGGWVVSLSSAPGGADHIPRPPLAPAALRTTDRALRVELPELTGVPAGRTPVYLVERESPLGSGIWSPMTETGPTRIHELELGPTGPDGLPLARLRFSQGLDGGLLSSPGQTVDVLTCASTGPEVIARAIAALPLPSFERRVEAHALLDLVGEQARTALTDSLQAAQTCGDRVLAAAARGRIEWLDSAAQNPGARLIDLAIEAGATQPGQAPEGILAGDAVLRGMAILRAFEERGAIEARPWAAALAASDPDPRVRSLAQFLECIVDDGLPAPQPPHGPAWLLSEEARRGAVGPFDGLVAVEGALDLAERPELTDLHLGFPLARTLIAMVRGGDESTQQGPSLELALQLIERARGAESERSRAALLGAVDALLPGDDITLAAIRVAGDFRMAGAAPAGETLRRRIELPRAAGPELRQALQMLRSEFPDAVPPRDRRVLVDLVLPPGDYGEPSGDMNPFEIEVSGVRLLAAGPGVILHGGVRVTGARDVILEGLEVRCSSGQALTMLAGAHVVASHSHLRGASRVVHVSGGEVELYHSSIAPTDGESPYGSVAQLMGGARLRGRASEFRGGSIFLGQGGAEVLLDRCVLDAGERPLTQGQRGGRVIARESLFTTGGAGFLMVEEVLLGACVVDTGFQPFGRGDASVRVGPELFALTGSVDGEESIERLDQEPIPMR